MMDNQSAPEQSGNTEINLVAEEEKAATMLVQAKLDHILEEAQTTGHLKSDNEQEGVANPRENILHASRYKGEDHPLYGQIIFQEPGQERGVTYTILPNGIREGERKLSAAEIEQLAGKL